MWGFNKFIPVSVQQRKKQTPLGQADSSEFPVPSPTDCTGYVAGSPET